MTEKFILGNADYAIVGITLVISACIGLYFRIFGGKQKTNDEYLLAGRDMSIFPVSFSLMATFMSTATLMGIPAEMYLFGTNMTFINIGVLMGPIIASVLFLPIYFNTGVSTSYEFCMYNFMVRGREIPWIFPYAAREAQRYLKISLLPVSKYLVKRFGESTRKILSGIFLLENILFNGVVLYGPSLALSAVTDLPIWTSVISTGVACIFYCTVGGMKAVLWTDVFQTFLMCICLLAIIITGCINLDGIGNIFSSAYEGERILLPSLGMDFSRRYTMWNILLQGLINTTNCYGVSQIQVQRQLTVRNLKRSRIASLISAPLLVIFQLLCCMCGLIFYVNFKSCDPMSSPDKPIHSADQLMPYYIVSAMRQYPGLPGLCIAGIFSASLSTLSSAVNSMAAVTYEDIIRPIWPRATGSVLITKIASVFYGVLCIFFTYFVASMGNLIKATVIVVGMVSGPTLGVYLLATLSTTANEMGANIGVITGFALAGSLAYITNSRHYPVLPLGSNCSEPVTKLNFTTGFSTTNASINNIESLMSTMEPEDNFPVSYMWISPLSLVVCVIVGYFASWTVSCIRGRSENVPYELLSPVRHWFFKEEQVVEKEKPIIHDESKDINISSF